MKRSASSSQLLIDSTAMTFGKAFLLYALPITLLRRKMKKSTLRRASALGAFMAVTKACNEYIETIIPSQDDRVGGVAIYRFLKKYSHGTGGAIGAIAALSIDSGLSYSTFVIWLAIRAIRCVSEETFLEDWAKSIPFFHTISMCLSAGQILSSWISGNKQLDAGYYRFLSVQGGRSTEFMQLIRSKTVVDPLTAFGFGFRDFCSFWPAGLLRAMKLYAPLYALVLVFSLIQPKNHTPARMKTAFMNFFIHVLRSSVFLSTYCALAWTSFAIWPFKRMYDRNNVPVTANTMKYHAWIAGLATLVERKDRRAELAAYCATYAIDSLWRRYTVRYPVLGPFWSDWIPKITLVMSCAVLLHYHNKQPNLVAKWLLGFSTEDILPVSRRKRSSQQNEQKKEQEKTKR